MSRQGLTLLGLGGGLNPITHIRLVLCMRTPLDRTQPPITTVHRCYQHTIPTHCCRFSRHNNITSNRRHPNHLTHRNNLRKPTDHIQTVQWRLHNHKSLRHRRLAIHLCHHRQVSVAFCTIVKRFFFFLLFFIAVWVGWFFHVVDDRKAHK